MGAANFETIGFGKDLRDAFSNTVRQAQYEYGHGGYTGTIAEKGGVVFAGKLSRVTVRSLLDSIYDVTSVYDVDEVYSKTAGTWVEKRTNERTKAIARLPKSLQSLNWKTIASAYDDKWGDAAAIEVTGKAATELKARHGRKGTRDKVFLFVGMASS